MFADEVTFTVKGGDGGDGRASFYPKKKSGPDGGSGGRGGSVYFRGSTDLQDLYEFLIKKKIEAPGGEAGGKNQQEGRKGADMEVLVPLGTVLIDQENNTSFEFTNTSEKIKVCEGGRGGLGNYELRSPTNTTPKVAQRGQRGEERRIKAVLRLVADVGIIGLPNVGKTSLLNTLAGSNFKVGDYAFTTIEPNLGVSNTKVLIDIPGILEGALEGKGLGSRFLKHIEKSKLIIYAITAQSEDPLVDFQLLKTELSKYNPEIIKKESLILITKIDLVADTDLQTQIKKLKKLKIKVLPISTVNKIGIEDLKAFISA